MADYLYWRLPLGLLLLFLCCCRESWSSMLPTVASEPHLVYPFRTDAWGHVISSDVTSFYSKDGGRRVKRASNNNNNNNNNNSSSNSTNKTLEKLYIVINNEDEELFLKLTPNTKLVTPNTRIEWVLEDGRRVLKRPSGDCFYIGKLQSTRHSIVAISNCDGLTGYIQTQNESYFIEPLKGQLLQNGEDEKTDEARDAHPQPHLIYKVKSITSRLNLSLQQDQEFGEQQQLPVEEGKEEEEEGKEEEEEEEAELVEENVEGSKRYVEEEMTILELDDLFRTKRSLESANRKRKRLKRISQTKENRLSKPYWAKRENNNRIQFLKKKKKQLRLHDDERLSANERVKRFAETTELPKFRRKNYNSRSEVTVPKFARSRTTSKQNEVRNERIGRSTEEKRPKFVRMGMSSETTESDRRKRDESTDRINEGRAEENDNDGRETGEVSETENSDNGERRRNRNRDNKRKKKRKNRKNRKRKGCKKKRQRNEDETSSNDVQTNTNEEEGETESERRNDQCKKVSKGRTGRGERGRKKREKKEKKKKERERKKKERERRRQERQNGDNKKGRGKDVELNDSVSSTSPEVHSKSVVDPFEGEDWHGYSPDLFWETQVAAGTSGLTEEEVSVSPALNTSDPQKWLELAVAVDHTVINFHGEDEVEKYVFTLFNIVSAIYEDPSLEANLELVMLRIVFYKDPKQSQVRQGLAKKSLEAVNRWAERLYRVSEESLRHDLAVWLTKTDLGGPSGYAPVAGVCEPSRSCTLNRDEGLTSAFIIAHEMGHVLGLSHDGDPLSVNTCQDEGFQGSVMAPLVAATFSRFHWSPCSKLEYHSKASDWTCMLNKPEWGNATTVSSTIQYEYSLDDQCRMEFGEGFGLCRSFGMNDPCTHLWCSNSSTPQLCKTKKGPPLEGTMCGQHKWCRHGFCESMSQRVDDSGGESPVRHNPQDGGWGAWSDWGPCSRTCGTGVSFRTRACDNPAPAWGGRRCRGKREEWRVCGQKECPPPLHDFRAQQCFLLDRIVNLDPRRAALDWLPYEPRSRRKKCRISCYSHSTNEVYIGREYVVDGTRCSYDAPNDICVQGKCVSLGCDKVVGSRLQEDECGECGGRGATCSHERFVYNEIPAQGYNLLTTLPSGARQIVVREETATMNFLALSDNQTFTLNANHTQEPSKIFISEGARFQYNSMSDQEVLEARGPILQPLNVLVHGTRAQEHTRVIITYVTRLREEYYQWETGRFTACSVTCGGGVQHETLVCRDRRTDREVFHNRCDHLPRPELNTTSCNTFGCEVRWIASQWEHCSTTCGPHGIQQRVVSCVTLPEADHRNWTSGIVDPDRCEAHRKPDTTKPCLREPCLAHWTPIGWGQCSVTCGVGTEVRLWECEAGAGNEVTYECGPQPRQMRACIRPECSTTTCLRDSSDFCQLPVLHRYCKIPKYRTLCCHTCANVVYR